MTTSAGDAAQPDPSTLPYGHQPSRLARISLFRIAIYCALLPLVTGILIFAAWILSGWQWLMLAGLYTIVGGIVCFFVGCIVLNVHVVRAFRRAPQSRRSTKRAGTLVGILLLSNFPIAILCAWTALSIDGAYLVTVVNTSGSPLDSFVLSGPGLSVELGPLAPGDRARHLCRLNGDGGIDFSATLRGNAAFTGTVDGYVFGGADKVVTVTGPGSVTLTDQNRSPLRKWLDLR
jgi:hypothetical protein